MSPEEAFKSTAFIVGPFATLSQTFIYREFEAMARRGLEVNVVSTERIAWQGGRFSETLESIYQRAIFCEWTRPNHYAGFVRNMFGNTKVRRIAQWMGRLPHRSQKHRFRALGAVALAAQLAPQLEARGIRYLHAHFADFQTEIAMALSRIMEIPYGGSWHAGGIYRDRNILAEKVRGAKTVLTCTGHNVDHLRTLVPDCADDIHLAYHGLPLSSLPTQTGEVSQVKRLLVVGRLVEKKGFNYLIDALATLSRQGHALALTMVGDGPLREALSQQIGAAGLSDAVTMTGALPFDQVIKRIAETDLFVAPSVKDQKGDIDGIPNVILEAMAMGRPVIASAVSGIPEVIKTDETGLLVQPGDRDGIVAAIQKFVSDPDHARACGERARAFIEREFDVDQNIQRLVDAVTKAAS